MYLSFSSLTGFDPRGNQRDRDRERASARKQAAAKGKEDGLTPEQRRERDKKALEEKLAKKAAQAGAGGASQDNKSNEGNATSKK
ncbi:small EDRK-rich factor 2 [Carex littledalei]|uniref:Small EDRK-rich factor 2 n=1 Tax=Carex littledalei TaxID=544730 RepID=A0A833QQD7_9POAL|nr:small EDRK-rich factor 2 [Carex littledalei]